MSSPLPPVAANASGPKVDVSAVEGGDSPVKTKGVKRTAAAASSSRSGGASKPKPKRARLTVGDDEATQVTCLDESYRVPLADGDCFYVPDLVDAETAQEWHDELVKLDECTFPARSPLRLNLCSPASRPVLICTHLACPRQGIDRHSRSTARTSSSRARSQASSCPRAPRPVRTHPDAPVSPSSTPLSSTAFATDPALEVKYSGHPVKMSYSYPPLLRKIQDLVEARLGIKFNSVFANLYEDGRCVSLFNFGGLGSRCRTD